MNEKRNLCSITTSNIIIVRTAIPKLFHSSVIFPPSNKETNYFLVKLLENLTIERYDGISQLKGSEESGTHDQN